MAARSSGMAIPPRGARPAFCGVVFPVVADAFNAAFPMEGLANQYGASNYSWGSHLLQLSGHGKFQPSFLDIVQATGKKNENAFKKEFDSNPEQIVVQKCENIKKQ